MVERSDTLSNPRRNRGLMAATPPGLNYNFFGVNRGLELRGDLIGSLPPFLFTQGQPQMNHGQDGGIGRVKGGGGIRDIAPPAQPGLMAG